MSEPWRILLIEDEPEQREVLNVVLGGLGYSLCTTDRAETAYDQLSDFSPDLIVTDVKLPGIDGFTFFEEVRSTPELEAVPFIFLTAYNDPQAIERLTSMTGVRYLTKPYEVEGLLDLIEKILPPTV